MQQLDTLTQRSSLVTDRRRRYGNWPTKILHLETAGCCETSVDVYQTTRKPTSLFLNIKINPSLRLADTFNHVTSNNIQMYALLSLLGKPEGKRPLGRPRRRWEDNIRMDLQEMGCGYMGWIGLAQDRDRWRTLVSAVMNLRVP